MEPIDVALERFVYFIDEEVPKFQHTLLTESDVRMKIIDPIFVHILGWTPAQIFTESQGGGYLDYRFTVDELSRLVVEAKRDQRDLGIDTDKAGRFFKLNGSVFHSPDAKEGINQAIRYCAYKNAAHSIAFSGGEVQGRTDTLPR